MQFLVVTWGKPPWTRVNLWLVWEGKESWVARQWHSVPGHRKTEDGIEITCKLALVLGATGKIRQGTKRLWPFCPCVYSWHTWLSSCGRRGGLSEKNLGIKPLKNKDWIKPASVKQVKTIGSFLLFHLTHRSLCLTLTQLYGGHIVRRDGGWLLTSYWFVSSANRFVSLASCYGRLCCKLSLYPSYVLSRDHWLTQFSVNCWRKKFTVNDRCVINLSSFYCEVSQAKVTSLSLPKGSIFKNN